MTALAPTLQAWFTDRLITQRNASPRTVAAYRDTLKLLLRFASEQTGKQPCQLDFADLDASLIGAFLNHLEHERGNSPRTRNARLAAIHSLYRYSALRHPEHAETIGRVIEIPSKRHERAMISYLDRARSKRSSKHQTEKPGWAPRSRAAASHDPDRRARLRALRPARLRPQPQHRRTLPRHREGPEGEVRDADR